MMTTRGELDPSTLQKRTGCVDNEREHTEWVEYWLGEELVHRSVHIQLKQLPEFTAQEGAPHV